MDTAPLRLSCDGCLRLPQKTISPYVAPFVLRRGRPVGSVWFAEARRPFRAARRCLGAPPAVRGGGGVWLAGRRLAPPGRQTRPKGPGKSPAPLAQGAPSAPAAAPGGIRLGIGRHVAPQVAHGGKAYTVRYLFHIHIHKSQLMINRHSIRGGMHCKFPMDAVGQKELP